MREPDSERLGTLATVKLLANCELEPKLGLSLEPRVLYFPLGLQDLKVSISGRKADKASPSPVCLRGANVSDHKWTKSLCRGSVHVHS